MSVHPPCEAPLPAGSKTYAEVWLLAYPVVFSMLAQTVMGLVDTLFMGWVSTTAQGAVGLGSIVTWTYSSFFVGTLTVINTFVAQHYGAGEKSIKEGDEAAGRSSLRRCGQMAWQGLALAAGFAVLAVSGSGVVRPLVGLFGAPDEVAKITCAYAVIRIIGAVPARCFEMTITSFMRGIGDTRTPMKVALFTVALNVPLNYWLVFGGLGVAPLGAEGAALATVASSVIGVLILLGLMLRASMRQKYGTGWPGSWQLQRFAELLKVGAPIGAGWLLEMIIWTFFTAFISSLGEAPLAAHNIVLQVLHLSFMPGVAISVAAQTLVGQSLGARDPEAAERRGYASLRLGVGFMAVMAVIFFLLGTFITGLFSPDAAVVAIGGRLFMLAAAFQVFDATGMISGGILRGAGDTRWPMLAAAGFAWFVFAPLIWLFGSHLGGGVVGSWAAATTYIIGLGSLMFWRVRRSGWKERSLLEEESSAAPVALDPPAPSQPLSTAGETR